MVWLSITRINTLLPPSSPLVVLSTLKTMYFKGESNYGYFISTVKGNDRLLMLDSQIVEREGWDFGITRLANGRTHFKIWNPVDRLEFACTAWTHDSWHEWDRWIINICRVQRLLRSKWLMNRFILNPNDPFDSRKIKAFLKFDQALVLSNDILNMIVVSYIEDCLNSRNFHHKSPVRRIETDSFKKGIQIEQQFVVKKHINWKIA